MPNYRRNRVPGGTYFFTVNLLDRKSALLTEYIAELRESVRAVQQRQPFHIDAWVILPEHMHPIWTLPPGDAEYSNRWRAIKKTFSKAIPKIEHISQARIKRNERGIWQRRFWEHTLYDDADYAAHMDYIHFNPVKHGWVSTVGAWPYSSFHRLVEKGVYSANWSGSNSVDFDVGMGERND